MLFVVLLLLAAGLHGLAQQPPPGAAGQPPPPPLVTTGLIMGRVIDPGDGRPIAGAVVMISGGMQATPSVAPGAPRPSPPPPPPRYFTDSEGRFAFRHLTRGSYTLTATKPGYSDGAHGRLRPGGPTRPILIDDGERVGAIVIRLFKFGTIAGTVLDDAGEPVVGVSLRTYRRGLASGRRVFTPFGGSAVTDDRGIYRIGNLVPGEYVVSVPMTTTSVPRDFAVDRTAGNFELTMAGGMGVSFGGGGRQVTPDGRFLLQTGTPNSSASIVDAADGRLRTSPTIFYASSRSLSQAEIIRIDSGVERSGVDIVLPLLPAVNISGQLAGPEGPANGYALHLIPAETDTTSNDPSVATAVTAPDGTFMFLGVPAGQYVVQTTRVSRETGPPRPPPPPPPPPPPGARIESLMVAPVAPQLAPPRPLLWASTPLAVGESDIDGLVLILQDGLTVSGRIEFDGTAQRPDRNRIAQVPLFLEPADGPRTIGQTQPARLQPDGTFTSAGVLPGKYVLRAGGALPGWTLRAAMLNGADVLDTPFDLQKDISGVILKFTDRPTDLRGTVVVPSGSPTEAAVLIFPSDADGWKNFGVSPRRMRMGRPGQTGSFSLGALPPGDYFILAIREQYATDWQEPSFLEQLARVAMRVSIGDGERKTVDVPFHDVRPGGGEPSSDAPAGKSTSGLESPLDDGHGPFVPDEPAPQVRDRPVEAPAGGGSISGVVLLDGTSDPIRRARVSITSSEIRVQRTAITDDAGRFSIGSLPAGRYSIAASKPAYLTTYYGARRFGRAPGTPMALAAGQQIGDVRITMQRGSVVSGMVTDGFGQPYPNARVRLMQYVTRDGEKALVQAAASGNGTTDDRGMYRLYGILPGTYVVSVVPTTVNTSSETRQLSEDDISAALNDLKRPGAASSAVSEAGVQVTPQGRTIPPAPRGAAPPPAVPPGGKALGYSPFFYPGTPMEHEAGTVVVGPNQDIGGIDIPVRLVPAARVEGVLLAPNGQATPRASVQLVSGTPVSSTSSSVRLYPDGRFQAFNVVPGRYTLIARTMGAPSSAILPSPNASGFVAAPPSGPLPLQFWAQQDIDVNGSDVTDVTLTLMEPMTVSGKVIFEAKTQTVPADLSRVRVMLEPVSINRMGMSARPAPLDAAGTFTIDGVTPGRYRLVASVPNSSAPGSPPPAQQGPAWMVKSSLANGRDTLDTPLEIGPNQHVREAIITVTDQVTEISGTIMDAAGTPVPDLTVVVFSTERALWTNSRRVRSLGRSTDGKFRVTALPPGEYYLAVVTEIESGTWGDPAFMEQLAAASITLTVAEGEKKVQDVRIGR